MIMRGTGIRLLKVGTEGDGKCPKAPAGRSQKWRTAILLYDMIGVDE